jgi:hypothetical protein
MITTSACTEVSRHQNKKPRIGIQVRIPAFLITWRTGVSLFIPENKRLRCPEVRKDNSENFSDVSAAYDCKMENGHEW